MNATYGALLDPDQLEYEQRVAAEEIEELRVAIARTLALPDYEVPGYFDHSASDGGATYYAEGYRRGLVDGLRVAIQIAERRAA